MAPVTHRFALASSALLFAMALPAFAGNLSISASQITCKDSSQITNTDRGVRIKTTSVIQLYDPNGQWTGKSWTFESSGEPDHYACPALKRFFKRVQGPYVLNPQAMEVASKAHTQDEPVYAIEEVLMSGVYVPPVPPVQAHEAQLPHVARSPQETPSVKQFNKEVAALTAAATALKESPCQNESCAKSEAFSKDLRDSPGAPADPAKGLAAGSGE